MSKSKTQKSHTLAALEAAASEKAKAEQAVAQAEQAFETGKHSADEYQRIVAARAELAFHVRVFDLASAAHAEHERAEAGRLAAEAEAQRLEQLAAVQHDIDANIAASVAAAEALATGFKTGWDLAVASQGLGGTSINGWLYDVQNALSAALVREGVSSLAVRIS